MRKRKALDVEAGKQNHNEGRNQDPNHYQEEGASMRSRIPKNHSHDQPNDIAPLVLSVGDATVRREGDRVLFASPEGGTPATEAEWAAVRALSQPRTGTGSGVTVRIGFASKAVSICRLVFLALTIAGVASLLVDSLKPLQ